MHLKLQLRLALLYENIPAYGTQAFLAETARPRVERAIRHLAGVRRAGKTCLCQDLPELNILTVNSLAFAA